MRFFIIEENGNVLFEPRFTVKHFQFSGNNIDYYLENDPFE